MCLLGRSLEELGTLRQCLVLRHKLTVSELEFALLGHECRVGTDLLLQLLVPRLNAADVLLKLRVSCPKLLGRAGGKLLRQPPDLVALAVEHQYHCRGLLPSELLLECFVCREQLGLGSDRGAEIVGLRLRRLEFCFEGAAPFGDELGDFCVEVVGSALGVASSACLTLFNLTFEPFNFEAASVECALNREHGTSLGFDFATQLLESGVLCSAVLFPDCTLVRDLGPYPRPLCVFGRDNLLQSNRSELSELVLKLGAPLVQLDVERCASVREAGVTLRLGLADGGFPGEERGLLTFEFFTVGSEHLRQLAQFRPLRLQLFIGLNPGRDRRRGSRRLTCCCATTVFGRCGLEARRFRFNVHLGLQECSD